MRFYNLAGLVAAGALSACTSTGSTSTGSTSTAGSTSAATTAGSTSGSTTSTTSATASSSSTGSTGSTGSSTTGSAGSTGSSAQGWHKFAPPINQDDADITGVFCSTIDKCVISTEEGVTSDKGAVYALSRSGVGTAKLLDGTYHSAGGDLPALAHQLGDLDFIGFSVTSQGLVARASNDNIIALNSGDVTSASAWQVTATGNDTDPTVSGVGAFRPLGIQADASNHWVLVPELTGAVYTSTAAPSASTGWTEVWDPLSSPSVPADFDAQYAADPTLCNTQVTAGGVPSVNHAVAISTDLSVIVAPSGGLNQEYTDSRNASPRPGVCISTDQGAHFYYAPFNNLPGTVATDASSPGPLGVNCVNKDTCYAFSGEEFQAGTGYVYFSTNASQGKNSTWTLATMPTGWATSQEISLADLFFAPDGVHGWAVGNNSRHALLIRTTDSGHTWTDVSASIASFQTSDLYAGFALDANHIWIAGRTGFIAATDTAQQ